MGRRLKNYAISTDALVGAGCEKYSDMKLALFFLRGMQRLGRLTDEDQTAIDLVRRPENQDVILFRVIDRRHEEVSGLSIVPSVGLGEADAKQIMIEGKEKKLIVVPQGKILANGGGQL